MTPAATATVAWTAEDLPLIGEPLAVELANTLYGDGRDRIDFLATPRLITLWFTHVEAAPRLPARLARRDGGATRPAATAPARPATTADGSPVPVLERARAG